MTNATTSRKGTAKAATTSAKRASNVKPATVLIVGAGFAGLGTAIRLQQAGIRNIVILERASAVGGTWRDNSYPGAACDIPSNLYSYSFDPNPDWSRSFSGSAEILSYIEAMVERFGLQQYIRFNQNVTDLSYDDDHGLWHASTEGGASFSGRVAVMAQGPLSNPGFPAIPGIEDFKGKTVHSAAWDHDYDFRGKRVGVIGTGASAIQIIPELAKQAGKLTVFQRTPAWVMPRPDFETPDWQKTLFRKVPASQSALRKGLYLAHESMALAVIWQSPVTRLAERLGRWHLRRQVKDRWLRRQLTPDYRIGCKRILVSNDYYPALQQPNSKLITWPIARISENGVRTVEGIEHQFDAIVYATGFEVSHSGTPFPVRGSAGRLLADDWARGAQAYKSINVAGYPNLFLTFGPNSGPGHNSALVYMESQIDYIVKGVKTILKRNLKALAVKDRAQDEYNAGIQKRLARTNWNSGCKSWYLTEDGFNATMYPGFATQYANQMSELELRDYTLITA
ncbi:flavin-containing monooxygenase [Marinobacter mobilis]|uniref:Predicted flavoprotein CzcO associated with the cation diffusion facilitator CzcD n=1 Tax=Marinobacter mobilis TaxID=488533 RepID=A0A1H2Q3Q0_9GAMM|nr:NAD(P)/FAD-dependent oxidoreductase [Marinobacter mobilis]SDW01284.1 Predicted flavoprotein CzcO associated with the cation diffusion facilitator CzcD [Marinobacter mobilis]